MQLARVVGSVVATTRTRGLDGRTLLVVAPVPSADPPGDAYVAVDRVGAGVGQLVLVSRGAVARYALGADVEVDAVVVAIVDRVDAPGLDLERDE